MSARPVTGRPPVPHPVPKGPTVKTLATLLIVCGICSVLSVADASAAMREDRPNAVGGELLGRGIILTVNYERFFDAHFGAGAGLMGFGTDEGSVFILPLYLQYLSGDKHNLYLSLGSTIFGGGGTVSDYETSSFMTLAFGYQVQTESGLYIRPFFNYLSIKSSDDDSTGLIWPGIAMGASF